MEISSNPTWREVLESERKLDRRLQRVLEEVGIDPEVVDGFLQDHDRADLMLRPVTERETKMRAMYASRAPI